jgi:hypothetical protein
MMAHGPRAGPFIALGFVWEGGRIYNPAGAVRLEVLGWPLIDYKDTQL